MVFNGSIRGFHPLGIGSNPVIRSNFRKVSVLAAWDLGSTESPTLSSRVQFLAASPILRA